MRIKLGAGAAKATVPLTLHFLAADAETVARDAEPSSGLRLKVINVCQIWVWAAFPPVCRKRVFTLNNCFNALEKPLDLPGLFINRRRRRLKLV